jgi:hypothetical protein
MRSLRRLASVIALIWYPLARAIQFWCKVRATANMPGVCCLPESINGQISRLSLRSAPTAITKCATVSTVIEFYLTLIQLGGTSSIALKL